MKVTKLYTDWLAIMKKAAEVVTFLQTQESSEEPKSLMLSNVTTMARIAGDGLLVLLRRGEKELAGDNVTPTIQGDLFPATPEDRAVVQADLRDVIETFFAEDVERNDSGRGPKGDDQVDDVDIPAAAVRDLLVALDDREGNELWPPVEDIGAWKAADRLEVAEWAKQMATGELYEMPSVLAMWQASNAATDEPITEPIGDEPESDDAANLAETVKRAIFDSGADGLSDDAVFESFSDEGADDDLDRVLWALIHTGELQVQRPELIYRTSTPDLVLDVMRMLQDQPALGTEDGLPEAEIVAHRMVTKEEAKQVLEGASVEAEGSLEEMPDLALPVSQFIHRKVRVTKGDILEEFAALGEQESEIVKAVDWLEQSGKISADEDHVVAAAAGDGLDSIEGDELRKIYNAECPGGRLRKPDKMREAIRETRATEVGQEPDPGDDAPPAADEDQPIDG